MCLDTVVVREDLPEAAILELRPASKKSQICEDAGKPAFQTEQQVQRPRGGSVLGTLKAEWRPV